MSSADDKQAREAASTATSAAARASTAANRAETLYANMLKFAVTWKGDWSHLEPYKKNELVFFRGSTYAAARDNRGKSPADDPAAWQLFAKEGDKGDRGAEGAGGGITGPVTNSELAAMPAARFKLRQSGSAGNPQDGTPAEAMALLPDATTSIAGRMSATDKTKLDSLPVPFAGYPIQYVATTGNDANDGTANSPKRTGLAAWNALAVGGQLRVGENTIWSDVPDSGPWINGAGYLPTGFLAEKACTIEGWGCPDGTQFGSQVVRVLWGSNRLTGTPRRNPGIWLVSTSTVRFKNIRIVGNQPLRKFVDYVRNDDLTVCEQNVTAASRAAGYTTLTVASRSWTITAFSRTSNVTKVRLHPVGYAPYRVATQIVVTPGSASGSFAAGTYTLTNTAAIGGGDVELEYSEVGADVIVPIVPTGASITGHGALPYDVIEGQFTNSQFPSTMYRVTSTPNPTTIVVRDFLGFGSRSATVSASNIGTYALQIRFAGGSFDRFKGCEFYAAPGGGEKLMTGPAVDCGDTNAGGWSWMRDCTIHGAPPDNGETNWDHVDPARAAGIFMSGYSGVGGNFNDCILVGGNIYIPKVGGQGGGSYMTFRRVNQNGVYGGVDIRPCVEMGVGYSANILLDHVWNADAATPSGLCGADLGTVQGAIYPFSTVTMGGQTSGYAQFTTVIGAPAPGNGIWDSVDKTYESRGIAGFYANGRIAGLRDDTQNQGGVYQGFPYKNVLPENMADATKWVPIGAISATGGIADPDGGTNAFRVSGAASDSIYLLVDASDVANPVGPAAVGDCYAMMMRVRVEDRSLLRGMLSILNNNFVGRWWENFSQFGGDGEWQTIFVRSINQWAGAGAQWQFRLYGLGHDYLIYQPTLVWLPTADYSLNHQSQIGTQLRARPNHIPTGHVGTMPGVKMLPHGGIGGPSSTDALAASPNGNVAPYYDRTTGALLGYFPLYDLA